MLSSSSHCNLLVELAFCLSVCPVRFCFDLFHPFLLFWPVIFFFWMVFGLFAHIEIDGLIVASLPALSFAVHCFEPWAVCRVSSIAFVLLGDRGGGVDVNSEEILSGHVREEPQVRVGVVCCVLILFSQVLVDQVLEKQSSQHRHAVPQGLLSASLPCFVYSRFLVSRFVVIRIC